MGARSETPERPHVAYKSEQGRYVRMASFWSLFGLSAYGVMGGFIHFLNKVLGDSGVDVNPWVKNVPLIGEFGIAAAIALGVQLVIGLLLYRWLSRPKVVDYLIETEQEMAKVVWPSWRETRSGAFAVVVTVGVMLAFLWVVDFILLEAFNRLFSINLGA